MLTHHRAVDRVRSEQRRAASALGEKDDHPDDRPGPEVQAITALLGEGAVSALALLTADKREALVLAYWGGYTQREIAVMTSTPLGTVKTRTRKGADSTAPIPRRRLAAKRAKPCHGQGGDRRIATAGEWSLVPVLRCVPARA